MATYPIDYTTFRQTPYILNYVYIGQVYGVYHEYTSVTNGTTVYLQIKTGSRIPHIFLMNLVSNGGGDINISLYEGATMTDGTTPPTLPPRSFDRRINMMNPSLTTFFVNPTSVNLGSATLISRGRIYSTGGTNGSGDIQTESLERVLQPNTTYLIALNNTGGGTVNLALNLQFYESGN